jgi:hypothetical protein
VSWVLPQFKMQVVFAVALMVVVAAPEDAMPGTKQELWQLAAVALHVIMQFVTFDDCASRILASAANAPDAAMLIAAAAKRIAKPRMTASVTRAQAGL